MQFPEPVTSDKGLSFRFVFSSGKSSFWSTKRSRAGQWPGSGEASPTINDRGEPTQCDRANLNSAGASAAVPIRRRLPPRLSWPDGL